MLNPFPKKSEEIVNQFDYPIVQRTFLSRSDFQNNSRLFEIFLQRKSSHNFEFSKCSFLSEVLWYSAKVSKVDVQDNRYILSSRRTPSAGGRHPVDIIISEPSREEKERRSFSYYNPFEHSLNLLNLDSERCSAFFNHINEILPIINAVIVWFIAHPDRTSAKYENSESLIWRDAGALIYCFQLVCTALGVKSCPVGSLGEPYISELLKGNGVVYGVGGLLIGE